MRLTNSELRPVITSSLCPEFFSNSGPISVNTVQIARDAKIFSSVERAVLCDMHANSTHTTTEVTARDIMAGCSQNCARRQYHRILTERGQWAAATFGA